MKIVVLDGFAMAQNDLLWEGMRKLGEVVVYDHDEPGKVVERLEGADIAITNKVVLDRNVISQLPCLKMIAVAATGYNVVDCKAASEHGITVANAPAYSTDSVAQTVFALLLNITNHIQHYADENRNGRWSRSKDFCYMDYAWAELSGKTFGVIGFGNIGEKVARIAQSFGMRVVVYTHRSQNELPEGVLKVEKEQLMKDSDIISLHCPLTEQSSKTINSESISLMKKSVTIINTGRGGLVDEEAVAEALKSGRIAAFGADVLTSEPPHADNPILNAPNAFVTPHIAWASLEARQRLMDILIANIKAYIDGKPINVVNG